MPSRRPPSSPADGSPADQPLWRGQMAPTEGEAPTPTGRRRGLGPVPHASKILAGFLIVGILAILMVWWVRDRAPEPLALDSVRAGDCLESSELQEVRSSVSDLRPADCSGPHDTEVFAVFQAGQVVQTLDDAGRRCSELLPAGEDELRRLTEGGFEVRPLVTAGEISPESRVVCFVRHRSGEKMDTPIMQPTAP